MRVALVNKEFDVSRGGGEVYACTLARSLIERGHEVTLVSRVVDLDVPSDSYEFLKVEPPSGPRHQRVANFNHAVNSVLDRTRFDVVHGLTQFFPQDIHRAGGGVFREWENLSQPNPALRAIVRLGSRNRTQRRVEDQIYAEGNYRVIQTNSHLVKGHVQRYYSVPAERIEVVHNGVDLERFNPSSRERGMRIREELGIGEDVPVVLFVGNIRRKGLRRLGNAMAHVKGASGIHVVVVGRGKQRRIQAALSRHPGPWTWAGAQSDVSGYYGMADLFVLPTRYDPFANVSLEALASGLAVVTTPTNGANELLTDGHEGYVSTLPDQATNLAAAIDVMLQQRGDELRARARKTAEGYPWSRNHDRVEEIYARVAEEKNQGGGVNEESSCPSRSG